MWLSAKLCMAVSGGRREDLLVSGNSYLTLASSSSSSEEEESLAYFCFSSGRVSPIAIVRLGGGGRIPNVLRSAVVGVEEGEEGDERDSGSNQVCFLGVRRSGESSSNGADVFRRAGKGGGACI